MAEVVTREEHRMTDETELLTEAKWSKVKGERTGRGEERRWN